MIIKIDTEQKKIFIEGECSFKELLLFIDKMEYDDFKISTKDNVINIPVYPSSPYPSPPFEATCDSTYTIGTDLNDSSKVGIFRKNEDGSIEQINSKYDEGNKKSS